MRWRLWIALAAAAAGASAAIAAPARPWGEPFPGVVQDERSVRGFVGPYKWLSNFYPCRVEYEGLIYRCSEGAYQAAKFPEGQRIEYTAFDADTAKKTAHARKYDEAAWEVRKDRVMREVVWAKFSQNRDLGRQLVATGDKYLEETNWWNDTYWGVHDGKGQNRLGRILMETRARLAGKHPFAVGVFCGSSRAAEPRYLAAARELGASIADHQWDLVWGGDTGGLMGAVASAAKAHGGRLIGVTTADFVAKGYNAPYADSLAIVNGISERKQGLQRRADAFVALPGGTGTMDELADTLEKRLLGEHRKAVILFDQEGYYDPLLAFLASTQRAHFTGPAVDTDLTVARSVPEIVADLEKAAARPAP